MILIEHYFQKKIQVVKHTNRRPYGMISHLSWNCVNTINKSDIWSSISCLLAEGVDPFRQEFKACSTVSSFILSSEIFFLSSAISVDDVVARGLSCSASWAHCTMIHFVYFLSSMVSELISPIFSSKKNVYEKLNTSSEMF